MKMTAISVAAILRLASCAGAPARVERNGGIITVTPALEPATNARPLLVVKQEGRTYLVGLPRIQ